MRMWFNQNNNRFHGVLQFVLVHFQANIDAKTSYLNFPASKITPICLRQAPGISLVASDSNNNNNNSNSSNSSIRTILITKVSHLKFILILVETIKKYKFFIVGTTEIQNLTMDPSLLTILLLKAGFSGGWYLGSESKASC